MTSTLAAIVIFSIIFLVLLKLYFTYKDRVSFYIFGLSDGFSLSDLSTLWKAALVGGINPVSLFSSLSSLVKCIAQIQEQSEADGTANSFRIQNLISKLYAFRNKVEKKEDAKKNLDSTKSLPNGQKLRIILPGKGVFASEIVNNGNVMIIKHPVQNGENTTRISDWVGQTVNVYLWKKDDARYVFDTTVEGEGVFLGKPTLQLKHTSTLLRSQKRNAIRLKCHIPAQLYIKDGKITGMIQPETKPGYKCILDNVSVTGAQIRIRGKALPNIYLQIQFMVQNKMIIMFGIVRNVEYNEEVNQSRLHFECIHIDPIMKNVVSNFVYSTLSEGEKEIAEAISYTEQDELKDAETPFDESAADRIETEIDNNLSEQSDSENDKIIDSENDSKDDDIINPEDLVVGDENNSDRDMKIDYD